MTGMKIRLLILQLVETYRTILRSRFFCWPAFGIDFRCCLPGIALLLFCSSCFSLFKVLSSRFILLRFCYFVCCFTISSVLFKHQVMFVCQEQCRPQTSCHVSPLSTYEVSVSVPDTKFSDMDNAVHIFGILE